MLLPFLGSNGFGAPEDDELTPARHHMAADVRERKVNIAVQVGIGDGDGPAAWHRGVGQAKKQPRGIAAGVAGEIETRPVAAGGPGL
jgi:hypothetical protein